MRDREQDPEEDGDGLRAPQVGGIDPAWSPGGATIAFSRSPRGGCHASSRAASDRRSPRRAEPVAARAALARVRLDAVLVRAARAAAAAARAEQLGLGGVWASELGRDPLLACAVAAGATERIELGTAIVVAFGRSPHDRRARRAWEIAGASGGRFVLGLGSQIRPHIEKRYSMPWSSPVARMRDYVAALRDIWAAWRTGERLRHRSEHYTHILMTPAFVPPLPRARDPDRPCGRRARA